MPPPPAKSNRKGWLLAGVVGVIAVIGALTYSTGDSDNQEESLDKCGSVGIAFLDAIETGLTVSGRGTLSEGSAVTSGDFSRVWFVAAEIDGPGMEGTGDVGVWATNVDPVGPPDGVVYAVNSVAMEFSDWGPGPDLSMSDDGAVEAESCLG